MYVYQLARFLAHSLLGGVAEPATPAERRWHFDREQRTWVEPHWERRAA
jgi:hypothetical protein